MMKMLGAMTMVLALMATAASDARADHERRSGFGFGFSFGDRDGGSFRFDSGYRDGGSFRFRSGYRDSCRPRAGHYEIRRETILVRPGGWQQVLVNDCGCPRYELQYVAPVYRTRDVSVWVNY